MASQRANEKFIIDLCSTKIIVKFGTFKGLLLYTAGGRSSPYLAVITNVLSKAYASAIK
jgi:hypothetical protein